MVDSETYEKSLNIYINAACYMMGKNMRDGYISYMRFLDLILNRSPRQFNALQQVIQEKKKIKTQSQKTNNKPTTVSLGYKVGMLYTSLKQGSIICFWVPTKRTPLNEWVSGICLYKNGKDNVAVTMKGTALPKMNINVWFLVKSPFLESDT